jgi:hypothetical protein
VVCAFQSPSPAGSGFGVALAAELRRFGLGVSCRSPILAELCGFRASPVRVSRCLAEPRRFASPILAGLGVALVAELAGFRLAEPSAPR